VAGIPVCLCGDHEVDAAVERTNRILDLLRSLAASP
jgi:hypothetical protein